MEAMPELRMNWLLKAVLSVAAVLVSGVLLFLWVTFSLEEPERRGILLVAAGGAVVICGVLLVVLVVLIQRPLRELQKKIALLRGGDLTVSASFADRNDEIGELGRNFNETVRQLQETREATNRAHQAEMSRAEHLATLGELAAGLAHEIRNPLAGIVGAVELLGAELPESSPSGGLEGGPAGDSADSEDSQRSARICPAPPAAILSGRLARNSRASCPPRAAASAVPPHQD